MPRAATVAAATFNTVEHLGAARRYRSTAATMARRDSAESAGAFFLTLGGAGGRATSRRRPRDVWAMVKPASRQAAWISLTSAPHAISVKAPREARHRRQGSGRASQSPQASNLGVELGYL
jgi:hypothetical protein